MEQKNRFSKLLEHLIATAEVKHYILAQNLQFDVSYISKWVSGRVLPSEKTAVDTLQKLSICLVENSSESGIAELCKDYQIKNTDELWQAIYDNLIAEYYYVQELQQNSGSIVAPKVAYFPEISMKKFLSKMHHPVLRRVKSLNIMAAMDLFYMDSEYRLQIVSLSGNQAGAQYTYPDVHFSLLINLEKATQDIISNTLFITSMLVNLAKVDFRLYQGDFAHGKAMFVVRDDFAISGMLVRRDTCASVAVCEGIEYSAPLYNDIQSFCTREALLFRKQDMGRMLSGTMDYIHSLLSPDRRWMLGHATEHLLPDDLFCELLEHPQLVGKGYNRDQLVHLHQLTRAILREGDLRLLVCDAAISNLVVTGEVDFFNEKIILDYNQRMRAMEHFYQLLHRPSTTRLRMLHDPLTSDFQHNTTHSIFLTSSQSYLRMRVHNQSENLLLKINGQDMQNIYRLYFDEVWNRVDSNSASFSEIEALFNHHIQSLKMLASIQKENEQPIC